MGFGHSQEKPEPLVFDDLYPSHLPPLRRSIMNADHEYLLKIILVGDYGCGKSSLLLRVIENRFPCSDNYHGLEFASIKVDYKGLRIKLQIWDTYSFVRFRPPVSLYYGACSVLICFDLDGDMEGVMENVHKWHKEADDLKMAELVSFVGCKVDLDSTLLKDPWEDVRNIVVAIKPDRDVGCAFAVLPDELIFAIALLLAKMDGERGLQPPLDDGQHRDKKQISRRDLGELSARYQRPVYLTSAKERIGIDELLLSLAEDIFETFWLAKDGVPIAETDRKGELRNTGDDGKDYRLQPYCIGRRHMKKANSNDNCSI